MFDVEYQDRIDQLPSTFGNEASFLSLWKVTDDGRKGGRKSLVLSENIDIMQKLIIKMT